MDGQVDATEALQLRLQSVFGRYPGKRGDLIPILQDAQACEGYISSETMSEVARFLNIPESTVYGVVTFYAQFYLTRQGRHKVRVCQGTACHVRGGHGILRAVESELGIRAGATSDDLEHSLETVACLGACSLAPVMTIDSQYFGRLTGAKAAAALEQVGDEGGGSDDD